MVSALYSLVQGESQYTYRQTIYMVKAQLSAISKANRGFYGEHLHIFWLCMGVFCRGAWCRPADSGRT